MTARADQSTTINASVGARTDHTTAEGNAPIVRPER